MPASSVDSLSAEAGDLTGLTVVVDAASPRAESSLSRLAAAGARPGLVLDLGAPPPADPVLRSADALVVRGLPETDAAVYALRTVATLARGLHPEVRILVLANEVPERVRAYVDGHLSGPLELDRPTAGDLVAASLTGGAGVVLVTVRDPDWQAVAAFARQRAFGTAVVGAATLTAEEIVARHQVQRRRQEQLVRRTIASGTTTLLFEVPGFVAPVTVTAATTVYRQPDLVEIEQRDIRVNGAAVAGGGDSSPPRLPLIEPERVATPPLAITLDDAYRYALAGRDGEAWVVAFAPGAAQAGLASGRAWIDGRTFALRRIETVQAGLRGAIVSSEQHDRFAPFQVGAEEVWLPVETRVYQMYEGAGHRTPIHRTIETPAYDVNPPDFEARLHAAYASPHLMLRDTPQGFRYLLRRGDAPGSAPRALAPRAGERMRTAVFGVLVDPNITTPLPFAGFSYVDLNLFDTGAQLNAFIGGTYGQVSWSVPSIAGTRWRAQGRAFAIAARYNDRAFVGGVEQYHENITQRPAHASVGVGRPLAPRLRARVDYELDYTAFGRSGTTAPAFVVPDNAVVHGLVATIEAEAGPWLARAWWNPSRRQHWRAWGLTQPDRGVVDAAGADDARTFQRYGMVVARTLALGGAVMARAEAAWKDGADLDRFSRYSFDAFENRLHGYPTASVRYDRGGVLRTVTSWAIPGWRIDGFADLAVVRDPGQGPGFRGYPGLGAAVEVGGPLRTLWSVDWGYGFRARRSDGRLGTQAVRVTGVRTF